MSGTVTGARKAKETTLKRNPNHFKEIGKKGGLAKVPKGFALDKERAKTAGKKGGQNGKRGKAKTYTVTAHATPESYWSGKVLAEMDTSYAVTARRQPKKRTIIDKLLRRSK